jgi:hypothetical protein
MPQPRRVSARHENVSSVAPMSASKNPRVKARNMQKRQTGGWNPGGQRDEIRFASSDPSRCIWATAPGRRPRSEGADLASVESERIDQCVTAPGRSAIGPNVTRAQPAGQGSPLHCTENAVEWCLCATSLDIAELVVP